MEKDIKNFLKLFVRMILFESEFNISDYLFLQGVY